MISIFQCLPGAQRPLPWLDLARLTRSNQRQCRPSHFSVDQVFCLLSPLGLDASCSVRKCAWVGVPTLEILWGGRSRPRRCNCRESWRGHGACSLRSVRLGLFAATSLPEKFPSAAHVPREANFSGLPVLHCVAAFIALRVRRARHRTVARRWRLASAGPPSHRAGRGFKAAGLSGLGRPTPWTGGSPRRQTHAQNLSLLKRC